MAKYLEVLDGCNDNYKLAYGFIETCRRVQPGETYPDVLTYLETCDEESFELPPTLEMDW